MAFKLDALAGGSEAAVNVASLAKEGEGKETAPQMEVEGLMLVQADMKSQKPASRVANSFSQASSSEERATPLNNGSVRGWGAPVCACEGYRKTRVNSS